MTQDNILLTFIVALVGVIGTGVGILASFIPIEFTGKRDYYQRNIKMWRLLDFERRVLVKYCDDPANHLVEAPEPRPMMISSLPLTAWQTVRSNGEFIADTPPELLNAFNVSYEMVDRLNATISHYIIFTATTNIAILPNYADRVRYFHTIINSQYSSLSIHFRDFEALIDQQIKRLEEKANSVQKWIDILKWIAGVVFAGVIIVSIFLVLFLIFHR